MLSLEHSKGNKSPAMAPAVTNGAYTASTTVSNVHHWSPAANPALDDIDKNHRYDHHHLKARVRCEAGGDK